MEEINPKYNPLKLKVLINGKPQVEAIPMNILDLIASAIEEQLTNCTDKAATSTTPKT